MKAPKSNKVFNRKMLYDLRVLSGMSLNSLAGAVGVNKSNLCRWENGSQAPRKATIEKLVEVLRKRRALSNGSLFARTLKVEHFWIDPPEPESVEGAKDER